MNKKEGGIIYWRGAELATPWQHSMPMKLVFSEEER
jgi:hypothetical protein